MLWPWLLYFLLFAISYFYSDNKEQSLFDTQQKLSLFLFPIIIGCGIALSFKQLERIFLWFIAGVSTIAVFCIGRALYLYLQNPDTNLFFYDNLIKGLDANAVNYAWYTLFAISALLLFPWGSNFQNNWGKVLKFSLIAISIIFFILLSARMLLVLFIIFVLPYYLLSFLGKYSYKKLIAIASIFLIGIIAFLSIDNPVKERFSSIMHVDVSQAFQDDYTEVQEDEFNNLTLRLLLWRMGVDNVKEHNLWLTGAGNGDAQALQNQKMTEYGLRHVDKPGEWGYSPFRNANLHNMFLQSLLMVGIFGALLISIMVLSPIFNIRKTKAKGIFLIFHVSAFFYMTQEAAFQTQGGVVFYSFFCILFWNSIYEDVNK